MQADEPTMGRRERKRQETRARILTAARALFLAKGFDGTTVDEIAERADISKRSFFDYFPSKEDVVTAWQDGFGDLLVARIAARPPGEPLARTAHAAMSAAIRDSASPEGIDLDALVRDTPSLRARMHLKYARLEARLAEALAARTAPPPDGGAALVGEPALLAMIAVGALRLGSEAWRTSAAEPPPPDHYTDRVFDDIWHHLRQLAAAGGD
ncbi:TetR/AcrR family transcriptional regulator [Zavarzinia compransoris]|uniref:TetR family transcriptional regulator n=1 Tax=Zavarzinia compransoris TaxID=1264899 RepID=A0A317DY70_9PROT|nr:TetR family transcriptional regulator [Zavarzinia compransoris]PWR18806.1 TetR family transcriptional regulator [Zavarzinia compransoris]TDP48793.1 TetR family transcriptional regulator [Zavarzinia compransoris]